MINVEIIKVHAGQIIPCGRVTGNKECTIGGLGKKQHERLQLSRLQVAIVDYR